MVVDTTKERLCVNQIIGQKTEVVMVEGDIVVPDIKPDILNSVTTSGNVFLLKKEVLDGKVRVDGTVAVYVLYLADAEKSGVRSLYTTLDFSQMMEFEKCNPSMRLDEDVRIKSIECKAVHGRKMNVKIALEISAKISANDNIEIIDKINDMPKMQFLRNTLEINSLIGEGSQRVYAKDALPVDDIDTVAEILKTDVRITNKDTKTSYNKILAKADAEVRVMYLTEDDRIKTINQTIPIMGFIDIPNINDDNTCDMKYRLKNLIVKPNLEEHTIYVEAEIELYCLAYDNRNVDIIDDLYCPGERLVFNQKRIQAATRKCNHKEKCTVKNKMSIPEISNGTVYEISGTPNIISQNILNDKIIFEGEVDVNIIFGLLNNVEGRMVKMPFTHEVSIADLNPNSNVEVGIEVENQDFIILSDGDVEMRVDMELDIDWSRNAYINVIEEIEKEEKRQDDLYNMVIYFVKKGDTLWKIAKEFGSIIEDIVRLNGIENQNLILPGQQLFIPKYQS